MITKSNGLVLLVVLLAIGLVGLFIWQTEIRSQPQLQTQSGTASVSLKSATQTPTPRVHGTRTAAAVSPRLRRTAAAEQLLHNPPKLSHGPVVGAVTSDDARVFVRTTVSATIQIRYSPSADLNDARVTPGQATTADSNFTAQVALNGLKPSTVYYLDVMVNETPQLKAPYPHFKSFPPAGTNVPFKFVILSDMFWNRTMTFRNADAEKPDFVILGGDFVHNDPNGIDEKRNQFKKRYDAAGKLPDLVNFILYHYPLAHFWDDHDFGTDNADKTYAQKGLALRVLKEFFPVYPVGENGDWQKFSYAQADFFMLDSRSQRDPGGEPDGPQKSLLDGDELGDKGQWSWLTQSLLASRARWKFIMTPVPFNSSVMKGDAWQDYPNERARLVQFIRANKIQGVIFISGDLHVGGIDNGRYSDFPEMVIPPANGNHCLSAASPGKWSEGVYVSPGNEPCDGYGVVTLSTNPDQVTLQVKDSTGTERLSMKVK